MKSGKRQITEAIKLLNKERIRTLGEKENYKYLGILKVDAIKLEEMKDKIKKGISDEQESFSKPSSIKGISLKG